MSKKALGKGLSSIFEDLGTPQLDENLREVVSEVSIEVIEPNPFQPRKFFSEEELDELAASLKANGVLQPILLRKHGKSYQLIAGERRMRAAQKVGIKTLPAQIRDNVTDRDMMELSIIENIQRVALSPVEEARAYQQLMITCGLTHEDLSRKLSKQRSTVTNILRLLNLDDKVQALLQEGKLTAGHARALLKFPPDKQYLYAQKMLAEHTSVRGAEALGKTAIKPSLDSNLNSFVQSIQYRLGTRVNLKGTENKGRLEIFYSSREELENLSRLIGHG